MQSSSSSRPLYIPSRQSYTAHNPRSSTLDASPRARRTSSTSIKMDLDGTKQTYLRSNGLPMHTGTSNAGTRGSAWRFVSGKTTAARRLRWIVIGSIAVALVFMHYGRAPTSSPSPSNPSSVTGLLDQKLEAEATKKPDLEPPKRHPLPPVRAQERPKDPPDQPESGPSPPPPVVPARRRPVDIDVRPDLSRSSADSSVARDNGRYLAYSPHSGYHNQRISLENALTLAFALGRTLLVPPVWLGHAIPYISFDKLGRRLQMASKEGLDRCKDFGEGGTEDPIPRECQGYWSWTQVGWEFLVDLSEARQLVPVKDRWNMSEAWLDDELDLRPGKKGRPSPDSYFLKDDVMYQYRFYDSIDDKEPLAKFETRIDIEQLAHDTDDYRLLHVGSMFGTSRLRVTQDATYDARSAFRRSMVFRNDLLDEITETIRDRLGGAGKYFGLHLRVGDGVFQKQAKQNMVGVWQNLCVNKMKLSEDVCDEMRQASDRKRGIDLRKRSLGEAPLPVNATVDEALLSKRSNSRPQRKGAFDHAPLPAIPPISSRTDSPLAKSMSCRGPLHTEQRYLPFNVPLFIATDSKVPTSDANLAVFFDSFPCTFTLGDFASLSKLNIEPVEGLSKLNVLRNKEDKVPLGQFLYPQLDAQVAAWGRALIGTPQSTFSRFAVDVLHQAYHGWEIVERG